MARRLPRAVYVTIGEIVVNHRFAGFHRSLIRWTGGRVPGAGVLGLEIILITTRGHRTGAPRTVPLGAIRDGGTWLVVASNAGHDEMPAWALNLRADPTVAVEHRGVATPYRAHEALGDERARVWPMVIDAYPGYDDYQRRTQRTIPIFVLEPA